MIFHPPLHQPSSPKNITHEMMLYVGNASTTTWAGVDEKESVHGARIYWRSGVSVERYYSQLVILLSVFVGFKLVLQCCA